MIFLFLILISYFALSGPLKTGVFGPRFFYKNLSKKSNFTFKTNPNKKSCFDSKKKIDLKQTST